MEHGLNKALSHWKTRRLASFSTPALDQIVAAVGLRKHIVGFTAHFALSYIASSTPRPPHHHPDLICCKGLNRLVRALEASQQQGGSPTSTPSRSGTRVKRTNQKQRGAFTIFLLTCSSIQAGVAVRGTRNRVSFEPHGDELRLKVYHVGDDFPMKMKLLSDSLGAAEKAGLLKPLDYLVYLDGDSLLSCDIMEFFLWSANRMTYDRRVKIAAASGMPDYRKPDKSARAAAEGRGGSNWPPEFERGSVTVAKLSASIALSPHAWMVRRSEMQPLLKEVLSPRAKTRCALCVEAAKEAIGAGVGNDNKNNNEQKNGEMWAYKPSEIAQVPSADPYNRLLHSVLLGKMALTADVPRVSRAMVSTLRKGVLRSHWNRVLTRMISPSKDFERRDGAKAAGNECSKIRRVLHDARCRFRLRGLCCGGRLSRSQRPSRRGPARHCGSLCYFSFGTELCRRHLHDHHRSQRYRDHRGGAL